MPPGGRFRRASGRALRTVGLAGVFVASAAGGIIVHANLPLSRRIIARTLSNVLSNVLEGTVRIDTLALVSPTRVITPHAVLYDGAGQKVLALDDVRIDASLRTLLRNFVMTRGRPTVIIDHVRVERADVDLIADPVSGVPTIVRAMTPVPTRTPTPADQAGGTRVYLPVIELGRGVGHARFKDQPPLEADVRRVRGQLLASPKGVAVDVQRFGAIIRGYGTEARGTGTLSVRAPGTVRGSFEGFFGDIELKANAFFKDGHVEISANVPSATPAAVSRMLPGWPIRDPVSGKINLSGEFPELTAHATFMMGPADVSADGPVHLGTGSHADLAVTTHHLDLRSLLEGAPTTDMDATGGVRLFLDQGRVVADARAHTEKTVFVVEGEEQPADGKPDGETRIDIPETDLTASFRKTGVTGTGEIHEPGVPAHAKFTVSPSGVVTVDASSSNADLGRNPHTRALGLAGRGRAHTRVHVEHGHLAVSVGADLAEFSVNGTTAREAHLEANVDGPVASLSKLHGTLSATANGFVTSGVSVNQVALTARGNRQSAEFEIHTDGTEGVSAAAAGTASLRERLVLHHTKIALRRGAVAIEGEVAEFDPEHAAVDVPSFRLTGAGGTMQGSLLLRPGLLEGTASGSNLDLGALATALNLPRGTVTGKARIDAEITAGRDVTRGRLRVGLGGVSVGELSGITLAASANLDGEHLTGEASGLLSTFAKVGASWDATLGGPAFELSSFRDAMGEAEIQINDGKLSVLNRFLPQDGAIRNVDGLAFARIRLHRKNKAAALPNAFATVATRGLAFVVAPGGSKSPVAISGMELSGTGGFDGVEGHGSGTLLVSDAHGALTTASFMLGVDPVALRKNPRVALQGLTSTPVDVVFNVPPRAVADLPPFLGTEGFVGTVSGWVALGGSLSEPTISAQIAGTGLGSRKMGPERTLDVHASGDYQWSTHEVTAQADATLAGNRVGALDLHAVLPNGDVSRWVGEMHTSLDGLPLDVVAPLSRNDVSGRIVGTMLLSRDAQDQGSGQHATADLRILDSVVAGTPLGEGRITIQGQGQTLTGHVGFARASEKLDADGSAGFSWPGLLPTLSEEQPARLHVITRSFGAGVLAPLLRGVVSRVAGRVDADVTVEATPKHAEGGTRWNEYVTGGATLRSGTALVDLLGVEVRDVTGQIEAQGTEGRTHIAVRDIHGKIRSPEDNIHGAADFWLSGVKVKSGTVSLQASDVPMLFRGAPQGRANGIVEARLTREPDFMLVDLDIPKLTVRLPQSSSRNVVDLSDHPDVTILQLAKEEVPTGETLPWRIAFHLGREVSIRRNDVDLGVRGAPVLDIREEALMTGTVDLVPGGRIPVLGKVFTIDHGRVIFDTGDSGNPRLDVTAAWRAQGDTTVYIDVTGTLREPKLHPRSDPPLPEAEVYALLLGGTTTVDQTQTSAERPVPGSEGAGAVALGGGVGALGVNELLSGSPLELRVDTTAESRPRYTAAVRVRPNLWFEASTYQQSQQTEGTTATDRNVYSGTVDYRFSPRWSLRTEVGTTGGAMDLLWQYRY